MSSGFWSSPVHSRLAVWSIYCTWCNHVHVVLSAFLRLERLFSFGSLRRFHARPPWTDYFSFVGLLLRCQNKSFEIVMKDFGLSRFHPSCLWDGFGFVFISSGYFLLVGQLRIGIDNCSLALEFVLVESGLGW